MYQALEIRNEGNMVLATGNAMRTSIGRGRGTDGALRSANKDSGKASWRRDTGLSCQSVTVSTAKGKADSGFGDQPKQRLKSK